MPGRIMPATVPFAAHPVWIQNWVIPWAGVPQFSRLCGSGTCLLAPAAMSALASRLPRATLQILPGASHMTPFTDPAALAEHILRAAGR